MRLRVMSYNILLGGIAPGPRDRTEQLLEVIASQRPDVLAIQEASAFLPEERNTVALWRARLGMSGLAVRGGSTLHLACFARPDLDLRLEHHVGPPFRHGALHVSIATPSGRLPFLIAHLNPFYEEARLEEVECLLKLTPPGPALLLGDFNGLSPQDEYDARQIADMLPQYRVTPPYKSLGNPIPDHAETRAIARLIAAGFTDLGKACQEGRPAPTYPTPGAPDPEGNLIRIDYVFGSAPLANACVAYHTPQREPAGTASDHYPVVCDLELP